MSSKRPDLRLAGVAVGAWLAALLTLHVGWAVGLAVAGSAAAGAAVLWWLVRVSDDGVRRIGNRARGVATSRCAFRGSGLVAVGVLLGAAVGAAATAPRVAVRDSPAITALVARRVTVEAELVVRDDPRPARRLPGRPPVYVFPADLHRITPPTEPPVRLTARVLVLGDDPALRTVLPGQAMTVTARLVPPRGGDLRAAVLSVVGHSVRVAPPPWHQRLAGALRAGLQDACAALPPEPGGLLPGLVVGDTSRLDPALAEDFRATGMTHLTAVSGANLAIVAGAVLLFARWCRLGPRTAAGLAAAALVGFVVLARPSPSVLRAAVMGGLGLLALASARHRATMPALCASVVVLVLIDPELAADPGFALSVLATAGLVLFANRWREALRARRVPAGLAEAVAVPAAAQLACAPVIAALSGTVSLVAVPANLLVVPAVAPATILGVVAAVLSPLWPTGATAAAWLGQWPAWWLVLVAHTGARLPAGALPWPPGVWGGLLLAALLAAAVVGLRRPVIRRLIAVVAAAAVLGALPVRLITGGWPVAGWRVVACAVDQGDAIVLPAAPGRAVVVDAGPNPSEVDRCLRALGVGTVSLLVLSHFHADHVGGVAGVFRDRTVATVVTPASSEPATGRELVHQVAAAHHVPVQQVGAGWAYADGEVRLTALGPIQPITGTRSDANNNSLVLLATVGTVRVLLPGDAEQEEQAMLLGEYPTSVLAVDVLKVPHHGSSYQDDRFLAAARPRIALVSVGRDNPYGHPNMAMLDRLARAGARIARTDIEGDVAAILGPDGRLAVATHTPRRQARPQASG